MPYIRDSDRGADILDRCAWSSPLASYQHADLLCRWTLRRTCTASLGPRFQEGELPNDLIGQVSVSQRKCSVSTASLLLNLEGILGRPRWPPYEFRQDATWGDPRAYNLAPHGDRRFRLRSRRYQGGRDLARRRAEYTPSSSRRRRRAETVRGGTWPTFAGPGTTCRRQASVQPTRPPDPNVGRSADRPNEDQPAALLRPHQTERPGSCFAAPTRLWDGATKNAHDASADSGLLSLRVFSFLLGSSPSSGHQIRHPSARPVPANLTISSRRSAKGFAPASAQLPSALPMISCNRQQHTHRAQGPGHGCPTAMSGTPGAPPLGPGRGRPCASEDYQNILNLRSHRGCSSYDVGHVVVRS